MTAEALFLNGVHESVLKGIIDAQKWAGADEIFCLQPYKSQAIAKFRADPPTAYRPTVLYLSTTDKLSTVSYGAKVVGWKDKTRLDESDTSFNLKKWEKRWWR